MALTSGAAATALTATRAVELAATLDPEASSACNGRTRTANGGISREAVRWQKKVHGTRCDARTHHHERRRWRGVALRGARGGCGRDEHLRKRHDGAHFGPACEPCL